jgi:hypothetical protein
MAVNRKEAGTCWMNERREGWNEIQVLFRLPCEIALALFHWGAFQISCIRDWFFSFFLSTDCCLLYSLLER